MNYEKYERLLFERREHGVLVITLNRPERRNAADARMLAELTNIWLDVANDPETRIVVVTGAGDSFSAGGDLNDEKARLGQFAELIHGMEEARGLVLNMLACDKPIISAINGVAVGAGLAVALLADISIIGESVRFTDGHLKIGLVAGDHAAVIWPLLCGVAKAKYYLLTADFIDGREAERIGLVSKAVPTAEVVDEALRVADRLGQGSQLALRWTKRSINHWVRAALPIFETSLGLEMLTFFSPDVREGFDAMLEHRQPRFPSTNGE